jgi:hypothetical protein
VKTPPSESANSVGARSEVIRRQLSQLVDHLEADARRVNDARFRKLAMKSAEVLEDLRTLFERIAVPEKPQGDRTRASKSRADDRNGTGAAGKKVRRGGKSVPSALADSAPSVNSKAADRNGQAAPGKADPAARKNAGASQSTPVATPNSDLSEEAPKPQDPDEIAAKVRQQRLAARAPKRPSKSAPRPVPAPSGKPVWSRPHSS